MSDVKWIKIVTDIFDDEKIILIESMPEADAIIVIWFKLLCLAGKQNNGGVFMLNERIAYTDEMLSTLFRRKPMIVKLALETFKQFGMIEIVENVITIPNWEKHQSVDALEKIRENNRIRVQKHREKQKELCNVTVTLCNTLDTSNSISTSNSQLSNSKRQGFIKPTIEEIKGYNSEIDAEAFWNFYESKGWLIGKNKMVSWHSAVANWLKRDNEKKPQSVRDTKAKEIDLDKELESMINDGV